MWCVMYNTIKPPEFLARPQGARHLGGNGSTFWYAITSN
jgi:hypothetical protein